MLCDLGKFLDLSGLCPLYNQADDTLKGGQEEAPWAKESGMGSPIGLQQEPTLVTCSCVPCPGLAPQPPLALCPKGDLHYQLGADGGHDQGLGGAQ